MNKSYVKLLLKQGVSKGSGVGWELEVCAEEGVSFELLKELADKAAATAKYVQTIAVFGSDVQETKEAN